MCGKFVQRAANNAGVVSGHYLESSITLAWQHRNILSLDALSTLFVARLLEK